MSVFFTANQIFGIGTLYSHAVEVVNLAHCGVLSLACKFTLAPTSERLIELVHREEEGINPSSLVDCRDLFTQYHSVLPFNKVITFNKVIMIKD